MKTRMWISAMAAMTVALAGCSGGSDEPESPIEQADGAGELGGDSVPTEAATPAEELRNTLHSADPNLCGTTGDEDVTQPGNQGLTAVLTSSCSVVTWDIDDRTMDARSVENDVWDRFDSYASIGDLEDGWLVVVDDQTVDPREVQGVLGGQVHTWESADAPESVIRHVYHAIRNEKFVDRCPTEDDQLATDYVREENRSVSLDAGNCKFYLVALNLSDDEVEEIKEQAIAEAESSDFALFWGGYGIADLSVYEKHPHLLNMESGSPEPGRIPGYILVRDTSPQAMLPEISSLGDFELLVD